MDKILEKMKRGVYYPGNHLGKREELAQLVAAGLIERMDASFLCGPDSAPTYCLTPSGCRALKGNTHKAGPDEADR